MKLISKRKGISSKKGFEMSLTELLKLILAVGMLVFFFWFLFKSANWLIGGKTSSFDHLESNINELMADCSTNNKCGPKLVPFYIKQGFMLMSCEKSALCLCTECDEKRLKISYFNGYDIAISGNSNYEGKSIITGDPGLWNFQGNRDVADVALNIDKNIKKISLIDCGAKANKELSDCKKPE